ncbi:peptidylprolyl isomerase [Weeksellaceae bacterium KMM 9724]|uniref:peptidylprolyl isomerase n=1 Tax=Profundicola chukchiensis TaxID=2961959 RepID=UPI00243EC43D|nr:peptidylprolyl isomerase [Profundicola chukchiensis]MDG4950639.1 peptidylprolyl isomerase [Profundicola chukchiensis]
MKSYLFSSLLLTSIFSLGQDSFIIVNEDSISTKEFKTAYHNNIEMEGIDKAVDTYINFKLLQQEAEKTKVDTTAAFARIYTQSIQPERDKYLYNEEVKNKLVNEIWTNLQTDRKVEIFALGVANPFDLEAKKERSLLAKDLFQQVCKNQPATQRVIEFRKTLPENKVWLRPMKSSAEIERVVYKTPVGACSDIQNSENGFFFVKVLEERPSTGIIGLDFIFNPDKTKLQQASEELKNDAKWEDVVSKYNISKANTGYINKPRWDVDIPTEFLNEIKNLEEGAITEPFEAKDGYYIIKFYKQEKFDNKDNWTDWIENNIPQSSYSMDYVQYVENHANNVVEVIEDPSAQSEVIQALGKDFFSKDKEIEFKNNKKIWSTDEMSFSQQDLLREIKLSKQFLGKDTNFDEFLAYSLPKYKTQFKLNNYITHLEKYESDFAEASDLLKQAIKVNHLIEYEIYDKAVHDSIGLQKYLNDHIEDYTWPTRYALEIYRYKNPEDAKVLTKMLKRKKSSEEILKYFEGKKDDKGALAVVLTRGNFAIDGADTPKNFNPKKKIQSLTYRNGPSIVRLISKLESRPKTIEEASRQLKEAYKSYYYEETLKNLKKNATISLPSTL